jgi:hypothetical protein
VNTTVSEAAESSTVAVITALLVYSPIVTVAETAAVPGATAVTSPEPFTAAIAGALLE